MWTILEKALFFCHAVKSEPETYRKQMPGLGL